MNVRTSFVLAAALAVGGAVMNRAQAQEAEDQTLLNWTQMRAIVNEASGERAMHHIMEFVPYVRVRPAEEYAGNFRENVAMVKFAREYGYTTAENESFPTTNLLTQPVQAELWLVEPEVRKLYDIYDVPLSFGGGPNGEVTAELVDVGMGQAQNFAGKDFTGKFVLSNGGNAGQARGATGFIGYSTLRPDDQPDMLGGGGGGGGGQGTTRWSVSPRVGRELAGLLARGEKVVVKSVVKTEQYPGEIEMVHLAIKGDGSSNQAVLMSCHLHEGYIKQGANDNASGCALILEVGRTYKKLVDEGKLPRQKRDIHFIGGPEISGTTAWLNAHPDIASRLIADLNYDMDGLWLSKFGSMWTILRDPDTSPTFTSDVVQSFAEFVGNTNRERVRYRSNGYGFSLPIVSPNGSNDPLYWTMEKYYGASDHAVLIGRGVPATMFNTWPDPFYHSSQDTPDKLDPTMFKRAAVVSIGALAILASAEDTKALEVAQEALGRGSERMSANYRKGLRYLAQATDGPTLNDAHKEARNAVRHQANVEKVVVKSVGILFNDPAAGARQLAQFDALIDARAQSLYNEIGAAYRMRALQLKVTPTEPVMTAAETTASRLVVERVPPAGGAGGGGRGGFGGGQQTPEQQAVAAAAARIPGHMRGEIGPLQGQKRTVLEIRDFISGEFEPVALVDVMTYMQAQEKAGQIKLVPVATASAKK